MGDGMETARAMATVTERVFGLLHGLADGMEIVTGGDYGKEQNQDTTERAHEDEGPARRTAG